MTNRTAANRYARALLDVAVAERADLQQVETQLADVAQLVAGNALLQQVLTNPAVPSPRKRALMQALTGRARLMPVLAKLLVLLAERDRLVLIPDLLAMYRDRLRDHMNVVRAEVTTAVPLTGDQARALEAGLARVTRRSVTLATRVDGSIIGGAITRVGDTVYDGSIVRQLEKVKERLVGSA